MNQMKNFLKSAMQKQKNAIFIHIWWVAPDINSHMSQRHPPAIIRPISQKALLKKMAPTWILVCQNLHFSPRNCTCTFFLFVFFSYLTCYLLLPIFRYRIWKKILWNFFFEKKAEQEIAQKCSKYVWDVAIRCTYALLLFWWKLDIIF